MWLLDSALRRPVTVIVAIVAVALGAVLALVSMRYDIFPNLNLPEIYVVQPYGGMSPSQMEGYLVDWYEQHFFYIDGIASVESQSIPSIALIKLTFHPGTDMAEAMSNTVGQIERSRAYMPPGTVGPFVLRFDAGSVPIGYLVMTSKTKSLNQLQDLAITRIRPMFSSLSGVSSAPVFGGNERTIVITIDPQKLRDYQLSADEVVRALTRDNVIVPNGDVRINGLDRLSLLNSVVSNIQSLGRVPIIRGSGPTVFLGDLGRISDSSDIITGYALVDGRRTVYAPVVKLASASSLTVAKEVKDALPQMRHALPQDVNVDFRFDQTKYVTEGIRDVAQEAALGAILTGLMVLLFLRDMRSAFVVFATIPISILGAIVLLWLSNQTINIMTLSGLALAIGILVDQSVVTIENIHTHLAMDKEPALATYEAGKETIKPNLLGMLAVISVFVPSFFMHGTTKSLFIPLSLAVGFAMLMSFLLSTTLVPIIGIQLLKHKPQSAETKQSFQDKLRHRYEKALSKVLDIGWPVIAIYAGACLILLLLLFPLLKTEIFPQTDTGQFALLIDAPTGTRFEDTEKIVLRILDLIGREAGGSDHIQSSIGYVGTQPPVYAISNVYLFTRGPHEALLNVALKPNAGISVVSLEERLREVVPKELPGTTISVRPGDIESKVMNSGSPTPIEIAMTGMDLHQDEAYARKVLSQLQTISILRDIRIEQPLHYPSVDINVDRELAGQLGVSFHDVGRSLAAATSSSRWIAPNYWVDPKTGVSYQVQVEMPQWHVSSLEDLASVPLMNKESAINPPTNQQLVANQQPTAPANSEGPYIRDLAAVTYAEEPGEIDHYNQQRMVSISANMIGNNLGQAQKLMQQALSRAGAAPQGVFVHIRGQIPIMNQTFSGLEIGLALAVVVILLLLTANFQSFNLAAIVLSVTPAILAGIVVTLLITGTSLNVQSFMGSIMAIGVGVANAIMLVTFAEGYWSHGRSSRVSAADAGLERMRPVLMTSIAMVAGMLPMALSGTAQASLAKAVVGGLLLSTPTVLLILPVVFSLVRNRSVRRRASIHPIEDISDHITDNP